MIDFTNPIGRKWWQDQLRPLLQSGVVGFKTDGANEDYFVTPQRRFHDGRNAREMHNIYPLSDLTADCVADAQKGYTNTLCRSGFARVMRGFNVIPCCGPGTSLRNGRRFINRFAPGSLPACRACA